MANNRLEFSQSTKDEAFKRQDYRCAICGKYFSETQYETAAHHIVPAAYGGSNDLKNCAILCNEPGASTTHDGGCHMWAHGNNTRLAFQLDLKYYKYLKA